MYPPTQSFLVRIYIGESDHHHGRPLYETIVLKAREQGLAGATVLRGLMGFGAQSHLHTAKILRLSEDLPVVIELIDGAERLDPFLESIRPLLGDALVTREKVEVIVPDTRRQERPTTTDRP